MTTPRTAAGRALLDELAESPLPGARYAHEVVGLRLAAIEAEARAAALDEARAAVERTSHIHSCSPHHIDDRGALAAIDELRERDGD